MTFVSADPNLNRQSVQLLEHHWEPYVRASVLREDGSRSTVDGKLYEFTESAGLVKWPDGEGDFHSVWVEMEHIERISRDESAWKDPTDQ